ncbi:hypothetical protein AO382_0408 [Moraxella catarrhalis]|uniref:Uncharacterized protein n=1 Tax=Moraxella catarrhalis TaxID=480 RepID=A0A7Z1A4Q2_MORCA|nr:hypothetical protein AO382_0408 [Moraxella catarrhalis]
MQSRQIPNPFLGCSLIVINLSIWIFIIADIDEFININQPSLTFSI